MISQKLVDDTSYRQKGISGMVLIVHSEQAVGISSSFQRSALNHYSSPVFRLSLTACLNSFEILKVGTFLGSTVTFSPVLGFLAWRRFLNLMLKDPNPLISMRFPAFRESMMLSNRLSTTDSVSFFVRPVLWAITLTRSAFVVVFPMVIYGLGYFEVCNYLNHK
jgi:hypothetical protein